MVSHSKCKMCGEILNVVELKDNPDGVGMVCADKVECKKRQQEAKQGHT
jgi:hypothetical protein